MVDFGPSRARQNNTHRPIVRAVAWRQGTTATAHVNRALIGRDLRVPRSPRTLTRISNASAAANRRSGAGSVSSRRSYTRAPHRTGVGERRNCATSRLGSG